MDSIRLDEADSAVIAQPTAIAVAPDGALAVADGGGRRVLLFERSGRLRAIVGRGGEGPGEFGSPSGVTFVGDSVLVVDDLGRQLLQAFAYPSGRYLRAIRRGGAGLQFTAQGGSVWLAAVRARANTTVTEWAIDTDSLRYHGFLSDAYRQHARLRQVYGYAVVAVRDDAIFHALLADTVVRRTDRHTGATREIALPRRARRGVPADVARLLEETTDDAAYAGMLSSLVAINAPSRDTLQAVHLDASVVEGTLTATGYLTTLDTRTGRACVDVPIVFSADAPPQVTFAHDTLVTIEQVVTGQQAQTVVRFLRSPRGCDR